ncbi:hypothetical protein [Halorussus salinisoli]|nr:hypothetical protein [Halorussus salinisoli]
MTYYECEACGQLADFADAHGRPLRRECPACEDPTVWKTAFADEQSGVSF